MKNLNMSISLKLFAYGIKNLHDPNWTGMILYDRLKQHVRGKVEPYDLLLKPLEKGFSYYLGQWIFEEYFSHEHVEYLHGEYKYWFIIDFCELIENHNLNNCSNYEQLKLEVKKISDLYTNDEDEYWEYLDSREFNRKVFRLFESYVTQNEAAINQVKLLYAAEFSDRMLHDRHLCFYTSCLLVEIGFDGDDKGTGPKQWVRREYWPERVKTILRSRDRGKCTNCSADLVSELDGDVSIDHMIPISKGGCNDLINLQILCSKCNSSKSASLSKVSNSIPKYIRRNNK
ncbi:TPA: HNH endonuclease [Vibrio alginolyticus]|uniref:HNH endonuclease n=1 Tax=Vibrio alginolyticus TaxID=663 RepID=UPI001BD2BC13|nr:HNH endonuclease signature motif containing protein [Vibrio alginolyticus]MBS9845537.1 HNH endonuclease [Vibrio alginolyticus]MCR9495914.1 HNH endonuclease [Vibrio alginolyticus]HCZ9044009.1 HNH endonuclease [Vibrio alginolyticus]HCZ9302360.1 HNH endonuclease [Vibrio alginolyticus]